MLKLLSRTSVCSSQVTPNFQKMHAKRTTLITNKMIITHVTLGTSATYSFYKHKLHSKIELR